MLFVVIENDYEKCNVSSDVFLSKVLTRSIDVKREAEWEESEDSTFPCLEPSDSATFSCEKEGLKFVAGYIAHFFRSERPGGA